MVEMRHIDPALALRVYRQAMRRDDGEKPQLRALVGTDKTPALRQSTRAVAGSTPLIHWPARWCSSESRLVG